MAEDHSLNIGCWGRAERMVRRQDLADCVGSGDLLVLATPVMAAVMEEAAVHCVQDRLPAGNTTVGIRLEIAHTAATPEGKKITAQAELTGITGKKLMFTIQAWDEAGSIGEGSHERVVVDQETFLSRVQARAEAG